jgi:hypothetical protein
MPARPFSFSNVLTTLINRDFRLAKSDKGIMADRYPKKNHRLKLIQLIENTYKDDEKRLWGKNQLIAHFHTL